MCFTILIFPINCSRNKEVIASSDFYFIKIHPIPCLDEVSEWSGLILSCLGCLGSEKPLKMWKIPKLTFSFFILLIFCYSFSLIHFLFTVSCKWEVQKPDGQLGALWGYLGSKKQFCRAFLNNTEQTTIFHRTYLICRMFVAIILVSIEIDSLWKAQVPIEGTLEFFWDALKFLGVPNKPSKGIF